MLIGTTRSINKALIRLTEERWMHIVSSHPEIDPTDYKLILGIIKAPDAILKGEKDEMLAVKKIKTCWYVVIYRELKDKSGFVITSYLTTDMKWLFKRKTIWNRK